MMKLLKAIFGSDKGATEARSINEPLELQPGDYIKLNDSFALPPLLRGKTFNLSKANTYVYGYQQVPELNLKGEDRRTIYLNYDDNDDEPFLGFSIKLKQNEVNEIFGAQEVKNVYRSNQKTLTTKSKPNEFELWLADEYAVKESAAKGQFFERDFRGMTAPNDGEQFTYYELHSADSKFAVEIEIWDEDEIDIIITLIRPVTDIHEMWPKA